MLKKKDKHNGNQTAKLSKKKQLRRCEPTRCLAVICVVCLALVNRMIVIGREKEKRMKNSLNCNGRLRYFVFFLSCTFVVGVVFFFFSLNKKYCVVYVMLITMISTWIGYYATNN